MSLKMITLPDKSLRQLSTEVALADLESAQLQKFIDDLVVTMHKKDGLGLAAVQVGKPIRIFSIATDRGAVVFVNPKLSKKSLRQDIEEEGCLSVPEIYGLVKRSKKVTISAYSRFGKTIKLEVSGLFARVIQHENDHLDGILFIDKAKKITKGKKELEKLLANTSRHSEPAFAEATAGRLDSESANTR